MGVYTTFDALLAYMAVVVLWLHGNLRPSHPRVLSHLLIPSFNLILSVLVYLVDPTFSEDALIFALDDPVLAYRDFW